MNQSSYSEQQLAMIPAKVTKILNLMNFLKMHLSETQYVILLIVR